MNSTEAFEVWWKAARTIQEPYKVAWVGTTGLRDAWLAACAWQQEEDAKRCSTSPSHTRFSLSGEMSRATAAFGAWRTERVRNFRPCGGHVEQAKLVWIAAWFARGEQDAQAAETECQHEPGRLHFKACHTFIAAAIRAAGGGDGTDTPAT